MYISKQRVLYCLTLFIYTILPSTVLAQTTYFVSGAGNDATDGRSFNAAFRSIDRVNQLTLKAGDSLLFRRGDVFRGTLLIRQSGSATRPILIGAYGNGAKPVLTGSVSVTNWVNLGNNRWQAPCPDCGSRVTGMYRNGVSLPLGRYPNPDAPNRGYLTVQAHAGNSQLTSQEPLTTNWTGAEVVLAPTYWIIDRAGITQQDGNTLTLNNPSTYTLTDTWGFLIQNHPATLDQTGEWYYNPANHTLQLYDDRGNPNTQTITATAANRSIDIANASFITIKSLRITEAKTENLFASNVSDLVLSDNDFTNAGEDGIVIQGTGRNILIEASTIRDINNNGVNIGSYQTVTFRKNTLKNIGVAPNRGKSGDGQFTAFQCFATQNTLIENNVVDSVGYIGVSVFSNSTIRQNSIANFCMVKSDGGGIYLWNGNQLPLHDIRIESNIVQKGVGTTGSLLSDVYSGAHGIFLDDCVESVMVTDNTISDCHGLGIYMHAVSRVSLLRNTCFNNSVGQLILYNYNAQCFPRNNTLRQNILVAKTATQPVAGYISGANDLSDFGLMAQNYYARPVNDVFTIRAVYNRTVVNDLSLSQWQTQFKQDLTSKTSPITYKDYRIKSLSSNALATSTFTNSSEDWSTWSPYNNGSASWSINGQLEGGSLQVSFPQASGQNDSYMLAYKNIQSVTKSKSYRLLFDARATAAKKIVVFMRQQNSPYQDLSSRYEVLAEPAKKTYELVLTALVNDPSALLTIQVQEDNQTVWLDNVSLKETVIEPVNPDNLIRLHYNPTTKDSLIVLKGTFRDVKNHYYTRQLTLKPFTSVILLSDSLPPVDVSLSLKVVQTALKVGDVASFSLTLRNESPGQNKISSRVQWACQLPANLMLIGGSGLSYKEGELSGTVQQLKTDTTFAFQLKATMAGQYIVAARVTATTYADPDSTPDSDTDEGDDEDDEASIHLSVQQLTAVDTTNLVTATEPVAASTKHAVYPNPTASEFSFITEADVATLRVADMLGRECLRLDAVRRDQLIHFGQQLPAGLYLLTIQYTSGEQRTMKVVKRDN
ncbi:right-handed parallel beta-helix repeat-containing protein [Spirosoma pollinicola]|nr:right-handed parallel beta-helix repeat-containing protein [Spirosoma pollinicola]